MLPVQTGTLCNAFWKHSVDSDSSLNLLWWACRGMSPVSESAGEQEASGSGRRQEPESAKASGPPGVQHAQHGLHSDVGTR